MNESGALEERAAVVAALREVVRGLKDGPGHRAARLRTIGMMLDIIQAIEAGEHRMVVQNATEGP